MRTIILEKQKQKGEKKWLKTNSFTVLKTNNRNKNRRWKKFEVIFFFYLAQNQKEHVLCVNMARIIFKNDFMLINIISPIFINIKI